MVGPGLGKNQEICLGMSSCFAQPFPYLHGVPQGALQKPGQPELGCFGVTLAPHCPAEWEWLLQ